MIVRTYNRRNRSFSRSGSGCDDVVSDGFDDSLSQESPNDNNNHNQDSFNSFAFSSQDSWSFDSFQEHRPTELTILPPRKKKKVKAKKAKTILPPRGHVAGTATLMETQEFGEMMEHVDEVNFALDGLKKGQIPRIKRASLLSLLSICGTSQQRRMLRTHGMAKTIVDAVLNLNFDDEPSNLAASALFYVLTTESQDDHLLDSPNCIRFLIKLLKPATYDVSKNKALTIGNKLLSLRKDDGVLHDSSKVIDSTSAAIELKVEEILVSCKQMKPSDGNDNGRRKPELNPKWIALLTMEKASLTTVALEDTSGTVRKTGTHFKEKLRELGGLNAVFEVARSCHSIMERCLKQYSSSQGFKDNKDLENLALLLKCLKIMENATFLSSDNQCHLLEMKGNLDDQGSPRNFVKLIISITKILSGISLSNSSSTSSDDEKVYDLRKGTDHASVIPSLQGRIDDSDDVILVSSPEWTSSQKSFNISQNSGSTRTGCSGLSKSNSGTSTTSAADTCLLKSRLKSSSSGSCSKMPVCSSNAKPSSTNGLRMNLGLGKRCKVPEDPKFELLENSQDPFAFDEDEFEPSKWDIMSGGPTVAQANIGKATTYRDHEKECQSLMLLSQEESNSQENHRSDVSCSSSALDEEKTILLADCLLAAVKVLMNLTNDNPEGCRQIGSCGGLETLSSLVASHFPSFSSSLSCFTEMRENMMLSQSSLEVDHQNDTHLSDQELDFLVAILGLLVNLVEKDGQNRSHLAAATVSLPNVEGLEDERQGGVVPLLCSIFLANQGAREATGEGKTLSWDDEEALLQEEKEAEKMIVEAYSALLLAFLSTESNSTRRVIAECLPDHNLATLVPVLERFVEFHLTLNMISPETHKAVIEVIESCRIL